MVIVGDDHPDRAKDEALQARTVPAALIDAKVNVRWGSEPKIATDNWYADLDDDLSPDVAIGRLTADTPEELAVMVAKIIAYENSTDYTPWRRRVNFIAGVGGFGMLADSVIDIATKKLITGQIPAGYQTSMTYASLTSPYCPDPRRLPETAVARHNEGCLFWGVHRSRSTALARLNARRATRVSDHERRSRRANEFGRGFAHRRVPGLLHGRV